MYPGRVNNLWSNLEIMSHHTPVTNEIFSHRDDLYNKFVPRLIGSMKVVSSFISISLADVRTFFFIEKVYE